MALVERLEKTTDAGYWTGAIPLNYRYTAGRAGQKFLTHLRDEGELLATTCSDCQVTYVPPMIYCERCLNRLEDTYAPLPAQGVIQAFTVCHEDYTGAPKEQASVVALVKIDGATGSMIHRIGGVEPAAIEVGMRVKAVLKPKGEREGSILDIEHFAPA